MFNMPFEFSLDDNPLDLIEDFAQTNTWQTTRINDQVLFIEHESAARKYMVYLEWDEEFNSINIETVVAIEIADMYREQANDMLVDVNNSTWLGHFTLSKDKSQPVFRYTQLLQYTPAPFIAEAVSNVIDTATTECDRFYTTFKLLSEGDVRTRELLSATIMKTAGEA